MKSNLFRIKICGVTNELDAAQVSEAGADAVGLNFFSKSKRGIDLETARPIVRVLSPEVQRVGVFVNETADRIRALAAELRLDWVQIHGDEPPSLLAELSGLSVIRAFRIRYNAIEPITRYLQDCQNLNCSPDAILLDAYHPQDYGGTGCVLDWSRLYYNVPQLGGISWVLAGGLTADNVAHAIGDARPNAVDTASGVESSPGTKDGQLVKRFVQQAAEAFRRLDA